MLLAILKGKEGINLEQNEQKQNKEQKGKTSRKRVKYVRKQIVPSKQRKSSETKTNRGN